jgi:sigma-E factor negative regulatory protein RseB
MRVAFAAAVVGTLGLLAQPAWSSDDDAHEWIERMSESLATRNYVGLFTHATGRQSETMRIVHRVGKNGSTERLVSLDGSGREIVRTPQEVHVYMPDRKVVLVEPRTDEGSLAKALPVPSPQLDELYTLSVRDGNKILGRDVVVVDIRPKDAHRYGYRLWLDEDTAMPLRTVVADGLGRPIEQISFTQIDLPRRIDPKELEPTIDTAGFRLVRSARPARPAPGPHAMAAGWMPMRLPPGFRLVASRTQTVPGVALPVQHLIFSDGFASISVFIEPGRPSGPVPAQSSSVGSANAFSTLVDGHVVTAVGEVPLETVRDVATSVAPAASGLPAPTATPTR